MQRLDATESKVLVLLEETAAVQWGLVTTGQAKRVGVERIWLTRLVQRGVIDRLRHGVYALPSATHGPHQDLQAAWLLTNRTTPLDERALREPDVMVSHASAASLHGIGDVIATKHHFTTRSRRQSKQADVQFYTRDLPTADIVTVAGLPTTSVARTLGDLAAQTLDMDHLAQCVRDALETRRTGFQEIADHLAPYARFYDFASGEAFTDELLAVAGKRTDLAALQDLFGTAAIHRILEATAQARNQSE